MPSWCGASATRATVLGVAIPILVVALFFAAWAVDTNSAAEGSVRNVELRGRDVGGLTEEEVRQAVAEEALDFARTKVRIDTGRDSSFDAPASDLGLALDQDATVQAVLDQGRDGAAPPSAASRGPARSSRRTRWTRAYTIRTDQLSVTPHRDGG